MTHARGIVCLLGLIVTAFSPMRAACQELAGAQAGPSYVRTLGGTIGGGLIGAAAIGLPAALLFEATTEDEIISGAAAGLILGAPVGYWLGQAWGASWGSSTPAHRVTTSRYLLPAALWTGVGLGIYGLIGDGFDPEAGQPVDYTSWYVGAVVGGVVQILGMSITAHRMAVRDLSRSSVSPISLRFRRGPSGGLVVQTYVQLLW